MHSIYLLFMILLAQAVYAVISTGLYGRALKKYQKIKIYGGANVNDI